MSRRALTDRHADAQVQCHGASNRVQQQICRQHQLHAVTRRKDDGSYNPRGTELTVTVNGDPMPRGRIVGHMRDDRERQADAGALLLIGERARTVVRRV
jgi:hypothetical protein